MGALLGVPGLLLSSVTLHTPPCRVFFEVAKTTPMDMMKLEEKLKS